MKKLGVWIFLGALVLNCIYAGCSSGQIDINTASLTELDEIIYVGPATANSIIATRPFETLDDLIDVSGIGEVKLGAIKNQGLACIGEVIMEPEEEIKYEPESQKEKEVIENIVEEIPVINPQKEAIKLSPQTIKSEENNSELSKNSYATYGLVIFCILLAGLFLARKIKFKERKNEFE